MLRRFLFAAVPLVILSALLFGCARQANILFKDDFEHSDGKIPRRYWVEGSQRVKISDGRLEIDSTPDENDQNGQCTVWLDERFSGDLHIAFDAHVLSSPKAEHNINFFLFFSDPSGVPLKDSRGDRADGQYARYHSLNGYIFTYVANGVPDTARFRLRDNPGFNLLAEYRGSGCKALRTYHIEVKKTGSRLQYLVDGKLYLDAVDDSGHETHRQGLIGFRTWRTHLWFDNLKVSRL